MTSKQISFVGVGSGYLGPGMEKSEDCQFLARSILDRYDKDRGGTIGHTEAANMMIDMYRSLNKSFTPSKADIDGFLKALDANKDGHVDLRDIETIATKHLKVGVEVVKSTSTTRHLTIMSSSITSDRMI